MGERFEFAIMAVSAIFFVATSAAVCMYAFNRPACHASFAGSGLDTRWSFRGGCQVQVNGRWLPAKNVRVNAG